MIFFFVGDFARRKAGLIKGYFFVLVPPFFVGVVSKKIRWQEAVTKRGSSLEKKTMKEFNAGESGIKQCQES